MTMRAYRVDCPYHYRPVPIRAAFVPCHQDVRFCVLRLRKIRPTPCAYDYQDDGDAGITHFVATSRQRRIMQIPIAMRSILATAMRPAVFSLEAYPTPAH